MKLQTLNLLEVIWHNTFEGKRVANSEWTRENYYTEYTCSKCGKKKTKTHKRDRNGEGHWIDDDTYAALKLWLKNHPKEPTTGAPIQ